MGYLAQRLLSVLLSRKGSGIEIRSLAGVPRLEASRVLRPQSRGLKPLC